MRVTKSSVGAGDGGMVGKGEGDGVPASQDTLKEKRGASFDTRGSKPSRCDYEQ